MSNIDFLSTYTNHGEELLKEIVEVFKQLKKETEASDISVAALTEVWFKVKYNKI